MDEETVAVIERRWKKVQERLGFTDDELTLFKSSPAHVKAVERARPFAVMRMVIEVLEARNCAAGYRSGDKFVVDSEGMLVAEQCPAKLCVGAIYAFKKLVDRMWQAFFDDSTEVLHNTVHCPDVGVHDGGAGMVTMRIYAVPSAAPGK
jgi:uncharacterized repeat protein (TIGR04076 family)